jgi:hypothetical protein
MPSRLYNTEVCTRTPVTCLTNGLSRMWTRAFGLTTQVSVIWDHIPAANLSHDAKLAHHLGLAEIGQRGLVIAHNFQFLDSSLHSPETSSYRSSSIAASSMRRPLGHLFSAIAEQRKHVLS